MGMDYGEYIDQFDIVDTFKDSGQKRVFLVNPKSEPGKLLILKTGISSGSQDVRRAQREIEIQNSLNSIYYPKNYDFQTFDGDHFLILEEYIDSESLSDCASRFTTQKEITILLDRLVEGLRLLWNKNVVHRDLKPDNILI